MASKKDSKKSSSGEQASRLHETVTVSDDTLDETPARALDLLKGIGKNRAIRAILSRFGYTQQEHARGWEMLQRAAGFSHDAPEPGEPDEAAEAMAQLDRWDERGFETASLALKHRHPDQHRFVFDGLVASQGPESVVGVARFLSKLDALEKSEERKSSRAADQAALDTLSARGIDAAERQRLASLVEKARAFGDADDSDEERSLQERQAQRGALLELRAWYEEWSGIARVNLTRKEHLIRLGLAQRKKAKGGKKAPEKGSPGGAPA